MQVFDDRFQAEFLSASSV